MRIFIRKVKADNTGHITSQVDCDYPLKLTILFFIKCFEE